MLGQCPHPPGESRRCTGRGRTVDLLLTHRFDRHLDAYFGYSHLFSGSGLNGTGPTDDQDFAYVGAGLVF